MAFLAALFLFPIIPLAAAINALKRLFLPPFASSILLCFIVDPRDFYIIEKRIYRISMSSPLWLLGSIQYLD